MTQKHVNILETEEIIDYQFQSLDENPSKNSGVVDYKIKELRDYEKSQKQKVRSLLERDLKSSRENNFKINSIVKSFRGISDLEKEEIEKYLDKEVARRLDLELSKVYEEGFKKGEELGKEVVLKKETEILDKKVEILAQEISELSKVQVQIVKQHLQEVIELINNICKWIVLRELKEDGSYIERLMQKLILELQETENLLIKVNRSKFEAMPGVIEKIEMKLGELKNCRVEVFSDNDKEGLEIESERGLILASVNDQFKLLDKVFSHANTPFINLDKFNEFKSSQENTEKESYTNKTIIEAQLQKDETDIAKDSLNDSGVKEVKQESNRDDVNQEESSSDKGDDNGPKD